MKYVCVDDSKIAYGNFNSKNPKTLPLTKGKIYTDLTYTTTNKYFSNKETTIIIIDDTGEENCYGKSRFKLLEYVREDKLNKLFNIKTDS